jgi:hypothetical protein
VALDTNGLTATGSDTVLGSNTIVHYSLDDVVGTGHPPWKQVQVQVKSPAPSTPVSYTVSPYTLAVS